MILWKADGNRIGWAFSGIGLSILCSALAGGFGDGGAVVAGAVGGAFWLSWIIAIGTLVLWFPTGRVPSPRWKWLERLGFVLLVTTFVTYTFSEQVCVDSNEGQCLNWVDNPIGIPGMPNPEFGSLAGPLFALYPFFMGAVLVSLFIRLRRARGIERLQLKWFLLACSSVVLALSTEFALEGLGVPEPPLWLDVWIQISFLSIPVAAALAILRYRLYEIDRIISRTVSYALVVGILGAASWAPSPGFPHCFRIGHSWWWPGPRWEWPSSSTRCGRGSRPGLTVASTAPDMTRRRSWTASPGHSGTRWTAIR